MPTCWAAPQSPSFASCLPPTRLLQQQAALPLTPLPPQQAASCPAPARRMARWVAGGLTVSAGLLGGHARGLQAGLPLRVSTCCPCGPIPAHAVSALAFSPSADWRAQAGLHAEFSSATHQRPLLLTHLLCVAAPAQIGGRKSAFMLSSVGARFRKQLAGLMGTLGQCQPHYIRCACGCFGCCRFGCRLG